MASRCVSAISALHPSVISGFRSDIADTHLEAMLHIIYSIPNMYINIT